MDPEFSRDNQSVHNLMPQSEAAMRRIILLPALLALCAPAVAGDEATALAGSKLRDAVSGKTIYLMTGIGVEIPIRYMPNGTIHGTISATLATLGGESVKSDTGRWWVANEQLCQKWKSWSGSRPHCYKFRATDGGVQWSRNDGETGTARIASF